MIDALTERFRAVYGRPPEIVARAPGRIEFIGNHTDYNGGSVLGAAIDRSTWVALARRDDGRRKFASDTYGGPFDYAPDALARVSGPQSWVNYPLGVMIAMRDGGLPLPGGFDYLVNSSVPLGSGISGSAAIELSSCLAFVESVGKSISREALVTLGRKAENEFVGVPCGILDQGVSGFGRRDHLVYIDCRGPRFKTVPLPDGVNFWIFNTHVKHALVDGLYAQRHRECMEAASVIGVPLLVDATPAMLEAAETRLSRAAYKRARHVIDEIARVEQAVAALRGGRPSGGRQASLRLPPQLPDLV